MFLYVVNNIFRDMHEQIFNLVIGDIIIKIYNIYINNNIDISIYIDLLFISYYPSIHQHAPMKSIPME